MKKILYKFFLASAIILMASSCEDMQVTNTDPNNPASVPSNMLMSGTEKKIMDYVYDNWFSGRQCLVYSQYWAQRNYTEEDRYQIRESVNNNYFNMLYTLVANLDKVIELNTNESTSTISANYGDNENQIAAARILKAWLLSVMTDTWGSIPYSEAGQLTDGVYYPKYDDQTEIYADLIKELTEAAAMIDPSQDAFTSGDMIFKGDASKWKKFANSLKCRLAIHISKVDPNWKTYIAEALSSGVFESNADNAVFHYSKTAPEYSQFYEGFYVEARNDFTISRPFMDILKGQADTLNVKTHPWEGVEDPRLEVYSGGPRTLAADNNSTKVGNRYYKNGDYYIGMPYGIPSNNVKSEYRNIAPNLYAVQPLVLQEDFPVPLMTYAELKFILSEYNGYSVAEYKEGVEASVKYWYGLAGETPTDLETYVDKVSQTVNAETVALQKYIDLYMNGTEAWVEYRRTGYPTQLLKPEEISVISMGDDATDPTKTTPIKFTTLSDTKGDILARVKYPTNESTLNGDNFNAAVAKLDDGTNNYYTKMFWDVRTTSNPHPANK
ncbi:SusD/RagB family nutrient-binding outer membrane lipoprotein [uncultured Bacteroides sp.]|uniref:SusD/RagB family nutrient-binding outer membrane lipoprotein n=1 Tax=uncultured Bacteroides sp. TaxID=162156 RepID=UPI002AA730C5|nr:SusD/RagB family nutrient-binding outer membrane lipoprotein [uncultured Bacteroides sp.]